ncbi:hypothetical protein OJ998_30570 [Solirubrobacter taibaiensis]|nr:hypothetical protein [Solirubrobacter taibaiensis]
MLAAPAEAKVTWPKLTNVQPGAKLTVKVTSKQRRAQLAFVRVSPRATLARKTLRNGRFTVTVPKGDGVTYELRSTVAGRRTVKRFTTPTPPPAGAPAPIVAPAPTPTPSPVPVEVDCGAGNTGTAELSVVRLQLTVTNRGPGCLDVPVSLPVQWTNADGDVIPVDCSGYAMPIGGKPPTCITLPAFMVLHVGEATTRSIPIGLDAGTYRVAALGVAATVTIGL